MTEILLFNSVFHDRVTPVSVSTLKPPLGAIGVVTTEISYGRVLTPVSVVSLKPLLRAIEAIPLKLQASSIVYTYI